MNRVEIKGTIGDLWRTKHYLKFRIFYADNQNSLCIELKDSPHRHLKDRPIHNLRQMLYPVITIDGQTKTDKEAIDNLKDKPITVIGALKSQGTRVKGSAAVEEHNYIEVDTIKIGAE